MQRTQPSGSTIPTSIQTLRIFEMPLPTAAQEMALAGYMRSAPGITLIRVQTWLEAEHGVSLSTGAAWNAVRRLGLSFKKRP